MSIFGSFEESIEILRVLKRTEIFDTNTLDAAIEAIRSALETDEQEYEKEFAKDIPEAEIHKKKAVTEYGPTDYRQILIDGLKHFIPDKGRV